MSFQLTMNFASQAELLAFFAGLAGPAPVANQPTPVIATTVTEVKEAPKAPKAAKVEKAEKPAATPPASETATTTPEAPAATEPAAESHSEAPAVTYDQVAAAVITYSKKYGRPAAVEVLKPFGITALPSAAPEQFGPIKLAFEAALEAAEKDAS